MLFFFCAVEALVVVYLFPHVRTFATSGILNIYFIFRNIFTVTTHFLSYMYTRCSQSYTVYVICMYRNSFCDSAASYIERKAFLHIYIYVYTVRRDSTTILRMRFWKCALSLPSYKYIYKRWKVGAHMFMFWCDTMVLFVHKYTYIRETHIHIMNSIYVQCTYIAQYNVLFACAVILNVCCWCRIARACFINYYPKNRTQSVCAKYLFKFYILYFIFFHLYYLSKVENAA